MDNEHPAEKQQPRSEHQLCFKYFKTICLSLSFFSLGLAVAIVGPTLPTLAHNLGVSIESISFILPARGFGYLVGSIISGIIFGKLNPHLMIAMSLCTCAVGLIFTPFVPYISLVAVALSGSGIAMGFLDTVGNVVCLQIWGEKSGPFLQTLHFSFALGATMAPLVAQPFIMEVFNDKNTMNNESTHNSTVPTYTVVPFMNESTASTDVMTFPYVSYAFIVSSSLSLLIALPFVYVSCSSRSVAPPDQKDTIKEEGMVFRVKMLVLLFFFFLIYVGAEVTFGVYVYTFAIKCSNRYSKDVASALNTIFWGAFAIGRFTAIFASKWFTPNRLLEGDLLGTFIGAVVAACFPFYANTADFLLWGAVGLYGFSMASIFPTGISWAEQYITINGRAAVALVVGAALGEMICPLFVGQFVNGAPMSLMYFSVGFVLISTLNYIFLLFLANTRGRRLDYNYKLLEEEKKHDEETLKLMEFNSEAL